MANKLKAKRPTKTVFVIMPFTQTPSRNAAQLKHFYDEWIQKPIEAARFDNRYLVRRSDETFNINEQIIKDLFSADIVIGDLSGIVPNPNVMYELGMRLAFSNAPVILIREQHADNRTVFDVAGFHAEPYDPLNPASVPTYLKGKLRRFEVGEELYRSPVLNVVGQDYPLLAQLSRRRSAELLDVLDDSVMGTLRLFSGGVAEYAQEKLGLDVTGGGTRPSDVRNVLAKQHEALVERSWLEFDFRPGSQPAVDYYIASPYLRGLIAPEIERAFTQFLIEYHARFLAGDLFWRRLTFSAVFVFMSQTELLSVLCRIIMAMLQSATIDEAKKHEVAFAEAYQHVYWVWQQNEAKKGSIAQEQNPPNQLLQPTTRRRSPRSAPRRRSLKRGR